MSPCKALSGETLDKLALPETLKSFDQVQSPGETPSCHPALKHDGKPMLFGCHALNTTMGELHGICIISIGSVFATVVSANKCQMTICGLEPA